MMEMLAPGRKARSRYFSVGEIQNGVGVLVIEAPDFPRAERDRLAAEIVTTYQTGALEGETLELARRIANAMRSPSSTLEALRIHLQADGRQLVAKIRIVGEVVPALRTLRDWIGIAP